MRSSVRTLTVLGALSWSTTSLAQSAEARWNEIAKCAAIDAAEARLACTDDVFRRAGLLDSARVARQARQEFGNEGRPDTPRGAPAPPPAAAGASVPSEPALPARARDIAELATTVAAARMRGDRLLVTTAEGSVWEQTQSESFRNVPKPGDAFSIERAALGGFRCSFERSTVYRCRRID